MHVIFFFHKKGDESHSGKFNKVRASRYLEYPSDVLGISIFIWKLGYPYDVHRIFGSVATREIAKILSQEGYDISHHSLSFGGISIKSLGEYQANIELHSKVLVPVTTYVFTSEKDAPVLRQAKLRNQKSEQQEAEQDASKEATDGDDS